VLPTRLGVRPAVERWSVTHPNVPTFALNVPTFALNVPTFAPNVPTFASNLPTFALNLPTFALNVPTFALNVPTFALNVPTFALNVPTFIAKNRPLASDFVASLSSFAVFASETAFALAHAAHAAESD
jgi:uncharacterized protein affecting Mg2+/Co2+ transport